MDDTLKLLFLIVNRENEPPITTLVNKMGGILTTASLCTGTAKSELLALLGLGETEKSLIIASAKQSTIKEIYTVLVDIYKFNEPNNGIAFTVPISAVGGPATLAILNGSVGNGGVK